MEKISRNGRYSLVPSKRVKWSFYECGFTVQGCQPFFSLASFPRVSTTPCASLCVLAFLLFASGWRGPIESNIIRVETRRVPSASSCSYARDICVSIRASLLRSILNWITTASQFASFLPSFPSSHSNFSLFSHFPLAFSSRLFCETDAVDTETRRFFDCHWWMFSRCHVASNNFWELLKFEGYWNNRQANNRVDIDYQVKAEGKSKEIDIRNSNWVTCILYEL